MHTPARGVSHWPFIIALVLLLAAIFLWFDQKGEVEKANQKIVDLNKVLDGDGTPVSPGMRANLTALEAWADEVTDATGFRGMALPGAPGHVKQVVSPALIKDALNPDKDGSAVAQVKKYATITYADAKWKPAKGAAAGQVSLAQITPAFREKLKEVQAAYPKEGPGAPPEDADDAAAGADFAAKKRKYDEQFAKYTALLDELVKDPQFKDYPVVIGEAPLWDLDKVTPLAWSFWDRPATAFPDLEQFLAIPAPILKAMGESYAEQVSNDKKNLDALAELGRAKDKTIDNADEANPGLTQKLQKEQEGRAADVARLAKEADVARAETERIRVSETGAQQKLAQAQETFKRENDKLVQVNKAQNDRIVYDKEIRDLEIQRDEPDGTITGADAVLGVGYISLGNQDKVYPGLKFAVSAIGRGAIRSTKGEVVVTKVLDAHYSQVRISSQVNGERPIAAGDMIANPFFSRSRPIHVYLAGDLQKYPKAIATARLATMGVIVEDKIWEKTDYVLIPSSMSVKPGAEAGAEAGAPKVESELDRLSKLAHAFGATLITESMIASFLDY